MPVGSSKKLLSRISDTLAAGRSDRTSISVLIPTKNEERNLQTCLESVAGWADEIVVADSQSTDSTLDISAAHDVTVLQFHYQGGWPKKRQWALDNHNWRNDWILLLDADEILLPEIKTEIESVISLNEHDGYWIRFQIYFLGRMLRHGGSELWKLSLFRTGKGRYEQRLIEQDASMGDMEVHEHVVVNGTVGRLHNPVRHENYNSLDRYIAKHNQYSNWEARVLVKSATGEIQPALFGSQAQRRRWLKTSFIHWPGSPLAFFVLRYFLLGGFLDGKAGFLYSCFMAIQYFHVKAKLFEIRQIESGRSTLRSRHITAHDRDELQGTH